jgi:excisionase family DNA binding protein
MDTAPHSQEDLDFLMVDEVARQLRVSPKTVRAWLVRGRMHGFKLTPKVWRIRREDFHAFVTAAERQADESMARSAPPERAGRSTDEEC